MTSDARGRSLAQQAAAWVPPWERPAPPPLSAPDAEVAATPGTEAEGDADAAAGTSSPVDPPSAAGSPAPLVVDGGPVADGEPVAELVADGEPVAEPVAVVEHVDVAESEPFMLAGGTEPSRPVGVAESVASGDVARLVDQAAAPADGSASAGPLALAAEHELRGALEAILLVVDEPVSEIMLAQVLEQPTERITTLLSALAEEYRAGGRGFELRRAAGGWRLYTRPEYAAYVERFVLDGQQVRLTQAALETLAVIAYKQPVTRSRISAIRGVNCDGVIRTLVSRGLIQECGTEPDSGAFLYRTTALFLEKLGLNSVQELPPLAPFLPDDVDEVADAQS